MTTTVRIITNKTRVVFPAGIPSPDARLFVIEPSTNLTADGPNTSSKNAGEAVTIMQTVYLSAAGVWMLTDADLDTTSKGLVAMSLQTKTTGEAMKVALPGCIVRNDAWTWATVGTPIYLSTTPGGITDTAPSGPDDVVRVVGWVLTENCIYFNPSPDYITLN